MEQQNKFLAALKKEIKKTGTVIKIAGVDVLVCNVDRLSMAKLLQEGAAKSAEQLKPKRTELMADKLTQEQKDEFQKIYKPDQGVKFETQYDAQLYAMTVQYIGEQMILDIISNTDGTPLYRNDEERKEVYQLIKKTPGAIEAINTAFEELQKKRESPEKK